MISPRGASRILLVDDESPLRLSLSNVLKNDGYRVSVASGGREALEMLEKEPVKLVVTDLRMPEIDGLELTRRILATNPDMPVMILTGHGSIESAVQAMRVGAADFLVKPIEPGVFLVRVARCLDFGRLRSQNIRLKGEVDRQANFGEIIGSNTEMKRVFRIVERVSKVPSLVLIEGEPGTGKELIARAIHDQSVRLRAGSAADYPYLAVNCGAFARTLLESQLFGHKKGAFTGAIADQEGVFVAAGYGTLFLDEITELDTELQVKLLRALQEREVTPLGSTQAVPIHARIVTATNQPVRQLVRAGRFRSDLYYRINVVNIKVPPLRERVDDIPQLVDYFVRMTTDRYALQPREVGDRVLEVLQAYDWPGNVRELQNAVERAIALGKNESQIQVSDLPQEILDRLQSGPDGNGAKVAFPSYDQVVRDHVIRALDASGGVKSRAAELLGIDRNRLYRLIRRYEIAAIKQ